MLISQREERKIAQRGAIKAETVQWRSLANEKSVKTLLFWQAERRVVLEMCVCLCPLAYEVISKGGTDDYSGTKTELVFRKLLAQYRAPEPEGKGSCATFFMEKPQGRKISGCGAS
mmetsp:Transcript_35006/g.69102  ORF Transcript_35006/g.69102 Transcript_35006/m.69102 type:complete len:116 (+) Transcript_35006:127-474(+)